MGRQFRRDPFMVDEFIAQDGNPRFESSNRGQSAKRNVPSEAWLCCDADYIERATTLLKPTRRWRRNFQGESDQPVVRSATRQSLCEEEAGKPI